MENGLLHVVLFARKNTSLNIIQAIKSIKNQTYQKIKLMVVDRNPADSMYSLGLQEDLSIFHDIEYIQNNELSIGQLYNELIDKVEGTYIGFMTSNDVWDEKKASLHIRQLELEEQVAASCSSGLFIDKRGRNIVMDSLSSNISYHSESWYVDNPAPMCSQVIYKVEHIKRVGGFDSVFTDLIHCDMLIRLSNHYKIRFLPLELCQCSLTTQEDFYYMEQMKDRQKIYIKYMEQFIKHPKLKSLHYKGMIGLAKKSYMWLNFIGYGILYCLTSPLELLSLFSLWIIEGVRFIGVFIKEEYNFLINNIHMKIRVKPNYIYQEGQGEELKIFTDEFVVAEDGMRYSVKEFNHFNYITMDKKTLKYVEIPEYVTSIKPRLFYQCETLERIVIPNTITEIGAYAFYSCKNLKEVIFQDGSRISNIGAYAFGCCKSIKKMKLPSNLANLGKGAFYGCDNLEKIEFSVLGKEEVSDTFPNGLTKIEAYTFARCIRLKKIEFSMGSILSRVEKGAFLGCVNLVQVVFTGKVSYLGAYAFAGCTKLKTLAIVQIDAILSMGRGVFYNCKSLEYFNLSKQLTKIAMRTFYGCSRLPIQKVPKSVLAIGYQAYAKCSRLDKVILYSKDITISPTAFEKHTDIEIK